MREMRRRTDDAEAALFLVAETVAIRSLSLEKELEADTDSLVRKLEKSLDRRPTAGAAAQ